MLLVQLSLKNKTAVVVVCLLVILFGFIAIQRIPIRFTPTVEVPQITVETLYPGAAPQEVEQQVTIPMEEQLNAVENMRRMTSSSSENNSSITLEFDWGVNTDLAVTDIRDRLDLVRNLPDDVERSQISTGGGSRGSVVMWCTGLETSDTLDINDLKKISDDLIVPRLRRVEGVAEVLNFGGREREIQVILDLDALRARGLTIQQVRDAIVRENRNVRGGNLETGRTRYLVRTVGQFDSVEEVRQMRITREGEGEVRLYEVADVVDDYEEQTFEVRYNGEPAIAYGLVRKTGANSIEVVRGVREAIDEINAQLAPRGVHLEVAYDETEHIWDSINMVMINMAIGAALSIIVLLLFLRSPSSTIIIGTVIPVALVSSVIMLWATGRSINIVSLAGLAFASGMVVDNSIVVLENIFRLRQKGHTKATAADRGATEVWGAIFASTMTTIAVFAPIVLIQEEAGQLFADIALGIAFAVGASLLLALYLIPAASAKFLNVGEEKKSGVLYGFGSLFAKVYSAILHLILRSLPVRLLSVVMLVLIFLTSIFLVPPADYLPQGNQNLFFSIMIMPPGLTLQETNRFMTQVEQRMLSHPARARMFAVARLGDPILGFIVRKEDSDPESMANIQGELTAMTSGLPGIFTAVGQASLFQRGLGGGKTVTLDIIGPDLDQIVRISQDIERTARSMEGVESVRSSFKAGNPELQVEIDAARAAELGLTVADVANVVETAVGGVDISLYREAGDEYDIVLKSDESVLENPDSLREIEIFTSTGRVLPLNSVASVIETNGPTAINHIERERSVTLTIAIAESVALQTVIDEIETQIAALLREQLPPAYQIVLSGSADDLGRTARALAGTLVLAIIITYLLLTALFQSFLYPLVIMLTVPLAATGGFLGLSIFHETAEFNVITMFGFVILIGIVVNNAILIVAQTLIHMRDDNLDEISALERACMNRLRPIFMSTLSSILGMLPLALGTGSGSELYRGLGIVVVGGLTLSTLFSLILVPAVFVMFIRIRSIFTPKPQEPEATSSAYLSAG